jgi:tetratricopeptide (TPR) repeat protein
VSQFAAGMEQRAEFHRQALALARSVGDVLQQAYALSLLGRDPRDPQRSREQLEEAVVLFRQVGDWRFLAQTLGVLGFLVLSNGDLQSARKFLDEAYEVNQQSNQSAMDFVLTGKAILCMLRGEYGQARTFLQTNINDLEQKGNRMRVLWSYAWLGFIALREGSMAEAQQILFKTIQNFQVDQNRSGLAFALDRMASLYSLTGKPEVAAHLIGWSDSTRAELGDPRPPIEQADLDRDIAAIKAKIGAAAYEIAYTAGRALTLDKAVALASAGK